MHRPRQMSAAAARSTSRTRYSRPRQRRSVQALARCPIACSTGRAARPGGGCGRVRPACAGLGCVGPRSARASARALAIPRNPQQIAVDGRQRHALGGVGVPLGVRQDLLVGPPAWALHPGRQPIHAHRLADLSHLRQPFAQVLEGGLDVPVAGGREVASHAPRFSTSLASLRLRRAARLPGQPRRPRSASRASGRPPRAGGFGAPRSASPASLAHPSVTFLRRVGS
jgi:hypothetical protein